MAITVFINKMLYHAHFIHSKLCWSWPFPLRFFFYYTHFISLLLLDTILFLFVWFGIIVCVEGVSDGMSCKMCLFLFLSKNIAEIHFTPQLAVSIVNKKSKYSVSHPLFSLKHPVNNQKRKIIHSFIHL